MDIGKQWNGSNGSRKFGFPVSAKLNRIELQASSTCLIAWRMDLGTEVFWYAKFRTYFSNSSCRSVPELYISWTSKMSSWRSVGGKVRRKFSSRRWRRPHLQLSGASIKASFENLNGSSAWSEHRYDRRRLGRPVSVLGSTRGLQAQSSITFEASANDCEGFFTMRKVIRSGGALKRGVSRCWGQRRRWSDGFV